MGHGSNNLIVLSYSYSISVSEKPTLCLEEHTYKKREPLLSLVQLLEAPLKAIPVKTSNDQ